MSRCIFCGYCELACPFDAITLGNEFEISEYSRDDLIYTKDMLLAEPIKRVPVADPATSTTRRSRTTRTRVVASSATSSSGWSGSSAAFACLGSGVAVVCSEPVLLGARADREPRLARRALPAALGGVRRRGAGARLRRRGDGDVPVRDRLPRRPRRRAVGGRAERGRRSAAACRRRRAARRGHRRDRPRRPATRLSSSRPRSTDALRQPGRDRPAVPHRPPARLRDHLDRAARRRRSAASILGSEPRRDGRRTRRSDGP